MISARARAERRSRSWSWPARRGATCSLLPEENEAIVEAALARHRGVEVEDANETFRGARSALCAGPCLRVWPDTVGAGGFFAARLRKRTPR